MTFLARLCAVLCFMLSFSISPLDGAPSHRLDQSIRGYQSQRSCYWNEMCKEEFQRLFRCRCPKFSYCRAPGKYYNARCAINSTGYIWIQPETRWSLRH